MSGSALFQTQAVALHLLKGVTRAPIIIAWQRFKSLRPDAAMLLPIVAAVLLMIGFGIVAVPMAIRDLPLLLN